MSIVERSLDKLRRSSDQPESVKPIGTISEPELLSSAVEGLAGQDEYVATSPRRQIAVDREALRDAGYLPETSCDRRFADEYRQIKRPLISAALASADRGAGSKCVIMMASALPGDGKTFTSINLALSMARERDTSVLLVDADVAKPHISRIFGADQEPGLLDALSDASIDVESLILPTSVKGLSLLPAGKVRDAATELLASARMGALMARILARNPRRLILLDSPPLLVSSESLAITTVAGQIVLVVRACKTPRQAVLEAITQLGSKPVSLVLNQGRPSITQTYYGGGTYGDDQPT